MDFVEQLIHIRLPFVLVYILMLSNFVESLGTSKDYDEAALGVSGSDSDSSCSINKPTKRDNPTCNNSNGTMGVDAANMETASHFVGKITLADIAKYSNDTANTPIPLQRLAIGTRS